MSIQAAAIRRLEHRWHRVVLPIGAEGAVRRRCPVSLWSAHPLGGWLVEAYEGADSAILLASVLAHGGTATPCGPGGEELRGSLPTGNFQSNGFSSSVH